MSSIRENKALFLFFTLGFTIFFVTLMGSVTVSWVVGGFVGGLVASYSFIKQGGFKNRK